MPIMPKGKKRGLFPTLFLIWSCLQGGWGGVEASRMVLLRFILPLGVALLGAGCAVTPAPVVARPVVAGEAAVVLAVRGLDDGRAGPVLAALQATRTVGGADPGAAEGAEVVLRTDDGRVLALVVRPRGAMRADMHVHLRERNGAVSIGD